MVRIILCGAAGRMGREIAALAEQQSGLCIAAGCDRVAFSASFPTYTSLADCSEPADVLVDFSNCAALSGVLDYCVSRGLPAVLCTTGYTAEDEAAIAAAAEHVAIFRSSNMSLGINLLSELVRRAARVLGADYDVEIIEKHHNQKLDAPSGTALMLGTAVKEGLPYEADYVYDRHERREKRPACEIGMHAVRGGTIVGEHEVLFAGPDEVITLSHSAQSRRVFAAGALRAAAFLCRQKAGLYNMDQLIATL